MKKNALILGASSDIGIKLIDILLRENYIVIAHYNNNKNFSNSNYKGNKNLKFIKQDFKDINDKNFNRFFKKISNKKISIFVNLVGYVDGVSFEKSKIKSIVDFVKINSIIPMMIIKKISGFMIKSNYGRIVNCSSIGVKFGGGKNSFNYSFSKHASEYIPSFIRKLASKNIFFNNIRIGVTNTKIHKKVKSQRELKKRISLIPANRIASTTEIAKYIYFLVSKNNSYMCNQTITVAGGEWIL